MRASGASEGGGGERGVPLPAARICQRGPKQGSEVTERGEGVFSPPRVGRFFENLCMKTTFLAHLMALLGGWLCEVTYTNPLFPPFF